MKEITFVICFLIASFNAFADEATEARKMLDKTATVVNVKSGVQANFVLSSEKVGKTSGRIAIKGNKFSAKTPDATVWYDGKTQWTYMKSTDEVNITTPTKEQQVQMNPLTFINLYKSGYKLSMKTTGGKYEVHMQAEGNSNPIREMYVVIDKTTYVPSQVRVLRKGEWITIKISDFKATAQSDATFIFSSKDFPTAEIIDLR